VELRHFLQIEVKPSFDFLPEEIKLARQQDGIPGCSLQSRAYKNSRKDEIGHIYFLEYQQANHALSFCIILKDEPITNPTAAR